MGYASKKRDFKSIQVNTEKYRWCFRHGSITLQSMDSSARQLEIVLVGWRDPWLCITGFQISEDGQTLQLQTDAVNEPQVVTAKFARQAISHGLEHGWNPDERGQRVYCAYKDLTFGQLESTRAAL